LSQINTNKALKATGYYFTRRFLQTIGGDRTTRESCLAISAHHS